MSGIWEVSGDPTSVQGKLELQKGDKEMIGKLWRSEQTNAALMVALSATFMVLVAKGKGPLSPNQILANVLSDPAAQYEARTGQPIARRALG